MVKPPCTIPLPTTKSVEWDYTIPPPCVLLRACAALKSLPVSGFPVADVKAIDVRALNARDDACCHWQTVLGAGFVEGTVCVCCDSVALWAVQLPQQQHQKTSSFIKHRLLSFPSCYRIHLGCPSAGCALIRATNEARCMEWWVSSSNVAVSQQPLQPVELTRVLCRWPCVRWLQQDGLDDISSALSAFRVTRYMLLYFILLYACL